jgi:putative ABC transport system ATP-binding protein
VIFDNLSFEIEENKFIAIIGKSGSGKSTLLNIIGGLDRPDSGSVIIKGKDIMNLSNNELADYRGKDIGFVFQDFNLIPVLSVYDNIVLPVKLSKGKINEQYIEDIMNMLEISKKREALPDTLSGGQKQRVAIARALANNPSIILADEPTGNLDPETGQAVLKLLIDGIRKYKRTLVMVTHDMDIADMADEVIKIGI